MPSPTDALPVTPTFSNFQTGLDTAVQVLKFVASVAPVPFLNLAVTGLTAAGPLFHQAVAFWQTQGLLTVSDVLAYHGAPIMDVDVMADTKLPA